MTESSLFRFFLLFGFMTFTLLWPLSYASAQTAPITVEESDSQKLSLPDAGELNTMDTNEIVKDAPKDSSTSISAPSVSGSGEDGFFDAGDLVPQGEMAKEGPVKVNPVTQPASKLIIVRKNYKADEKKAQLVSAERAMALGRYDSALLLLEGLYEKNKRDPRVLMGRAVSLQKTGRFDEAMQMYEVLAKVEPENVEVQVNMLGLLSTRYPSIALRRLVDLYEKNKNHAGLMAQIAIAYAQTGDAQSALRYLGMAASMEPDKANHIFNMAIISDRAGETKKAISYYEKALEVDTIHGAGRTIPRDSVYERLAQIR